MAFLERRACKLSKKFLPQGSGSENLGTFISVLSGTCLPLGSPFSAKIPEQGINLGKNSRTGISKAYDFPEQVKFILKGLLAVKNSNLMHIFDLIFS